MEVGLIVLFFRFIMEVVRNRKKQPPPPSSSSKSSQKSKNDQEESLAKVQPLCKFPSLPLLSVLYTIGKYKTGCRTEF